MKNIEEMIEVMQEFRDGKTIQKRTLNSEAEEWTDVMIPVWNWLDCDYRIKPKNFLMTNKELAEWCAKDFGQVILSERVKKIPRTTSSGATVFEYISPLISTIYDYEVNLDNAPVPEGVRVRPWGDVNWVEPVKSIYDAAFSFLEDSEK